MYILNTIQHTIKQQLNKAQFNHFGGKSMLLLTTQILLEYKQNMTCFNSLLY